LKRLARLLSAVVLLAPLALITAPRAGATAALTPDPTAINFGDVRVGTLDVAKLTLTNNSGGDVTIHSVANVGGQTQDFAGVTGINPTTGEPDTNFDCLVDSTGTADRTLTNGQSCVFFVFV